MAGRAVEVAKRAVEKLFSRRRSGNVEVHLSRDEVSDIVTVGYDVGYQDGKRAAKPKTDEAAEKIAAAGKAQDDAIHAIAQYVSENESELREALVRGRTTGDRPDLADDLRELLKAWRDAGTAIRDAALSAAKR